MRFFKNMYYPQSYPKRIKYNDPFMNNSPNFSLSILAQSYFVKLQTNYFSTSNLRICKKTLYLSLKSKDIIIAKG